MLKNKRILILILIVSAIILIPGLVKADTTGTTTINGINYSYTVNSNNEIENLKCTNISNVKGTVSIPSTIDGKTVRTIGNISEYEFLGDGAFQECTGLTGVIIQIQ